MPAIDKYLATQRCRLLQERAQVDPLLTELLVAYTRMRTDRGLPLTYQIENFDPASVTHPVHREFLERNPDLAPQIQSFFCLYIDELLHRRLPVIYSVDHLIGKLGLTSAQASWLAYNQKDSEKAGARNARYHRFTIPKRNGKERTIHAPVAKLASIQRWIHRRILSKQKPHPYATAFAAGSSIAANAKPHVGRQVVLRIDLRDFFPSIPFRAVRRCFQRLGYPYHVSHFLANLCTYQGHLPQGAPTSPALSNLVALHLDRRLAGLKKKYPLYYSRYADDLIISSNRRDITRLIPFLKQIISEEGFEVNESKLAIMRPGVRQEVTGVVVNQRPNPPATLARNLRATLHHARTASLDEARHTFAQKNGREVADTTHFLQILRGQIEFVRQLNPAKAEKLLTQWEELRLA